jgi:Holliday junction resolvase RusA-like endonuclease
VKETTIEIPIPPSANNLWRVVKRRPRRGRCGKQTKGVIRTQHYQNWLEDTVPLIRVGMPVFRGPVKVVITIRGGEGFGEDRDIGNTEKATLDAMVHACRIANDNCQHVVHEEIVYLLPLPGKPACCWLTVREVDLKDYTIEEDQ